MVMARYVTSPTGFELIKAFEGFRALAAPLSGGGWVIGYGHTISARKGAKISKADAADLLKWDVSRLEEPLCELIYAPLSQNQFDALMSLAFNIGLVNFKNSMVLRRLNEGCPVGAAAGFDAWRRAKLAGEVIIVDALVRRRAAEKALFLASPEASVIAPTPQLPPLCDADMDNEHTRETPREVLVDLHGTGRKTVEITDTISPALETALPETEPEVIPQDGLVSLDDAFDSSAVSPDSEGEDDRDDDQTVATSPVAEIAEQIAGRLESVAIEPDPTIEGGTDDDVLQLQSSDQAAQDSNTDGAEDAAADEDTPPLVDQEGILLEPYEPEIPPQRDNQDAGEPYDESLARFQYDAPDYNEQDMDPQTLVTDAQITENSGDFQPAYDRGRWVFILMGIIGIAMTLGGLWQIQNATSITTNLDLAKGPGQAFLGVLLVVVSAYYLLRRLNR